MGRQLTRREVAACYPCDWWDGLEKRVGVLPDPELHEVGERSVRPLKRHIELEAAQGPLRARETSVVKTMSTFSSSSADKDTPLNPSLQWAEACLRTGCTPDLLPSPLQGRLRVPASLLISLQRFFSVLQVGLLALHGDNSGLSLDIIIATSCPQDYMTHQEKSEVERTSTLGVPSSPRMAGLSQDQLFAVTKGDGHGGGLVCQALCFSL